jgi:hypothetical protein
MKNRLVVGFGIAIFTTLLVVIIVNFTSREDLGEPELVVYGSLRLSDGIEIVETLERLEAWRSHIVKAEILRSRVECHNGPRCTHEYDPRGCALSLITIYTVRVLESFRGDREAGREVEVRMSGGRSGIIELVNQRADQNRVPLAIGDEFIFFLAYWWLEEPMLLVSPNVLVSTVYRIPSHLTAELSNGITNAFLSNPSLAYEVLEDYNLYIALNAHHFPMVTLGLTIGDLMRIAGVLE